MAIARTPATRRIEDRELRGRPPNQAAPLGMASPSLSLTMVRFVVRPYAEFCVHALLCTRPLTLCLACSGDGTLPTRRVSLYLL